MLKAKREYEGSLVAWEACAIIAFMPFTGKRLDPGALNPYRQRDPEADERIESIKRFIRAMAFEVKVGEAMRAAGKTVG